MASLFEFMIISVFEVWRVIKWIGPANIQVYYFKGINCWVELPASVNYLCRRTLWAQLCVGGGLIFPAHYWMFSLAWEQPINCACHNGPAPALLSLGISNKASHFLTQHSGYKNCHNMDIQCLKEIQTSRGQHFTSTTNPYNKHFHSSAKYELTSRERVHHFLPNPDSLSKITSLTSSNVHIWWLPLFFLLSYLPGDVRSAFIAYCIKSKWQKRKNNDWYFVSIVPARGGGISPVWVTNTSCVPVYATLYLIQ